MGRKSRAKKERRETVRDTPDEPAANPRGWLPVAGPWIVGGSVAVVIALTSWLWPDQPRIADISASFIRAGNLEIKYAGAPSQTTSPVCGCDRSQPLGDWRGLTLPARNLTAERVAGGTANTSYSIFNAPASLWTAAPIMRGMTATVTVADAPPSMLVSGKTLLAAGGINAPRLVYRRTLLVDSMEVGIAGRLHISSRSRAPVAALSVPRDVVASLHYLGPPATPLDHTLRIRAPFNPQVDQRTQPQVADAVPILDVLGPRTLVWGALSGSVGFTYNTTRVPLPAPNGRAHEFQQIRTTSLQRWPEPPLGWRRYVAISTEKDVFALRMVAFPADAEGNRSAVENPGTALGDIELRIPRVVAQAEALVPIFAAVNKDPVVRLDHVPFIPFLGPGTGTDRFVGDGVGQAEYEYHDEVLEMPPTPPVSGVNVFGSMRELRLSAGKGVLNIGADDARRVSAPSPVEFLELSPGATGRHALIPVRVDEDSAKINVRGRADVRINGRPVATERPLIARILSSEVLALIATIAGAATFGNGIRLFRKFSPRPARDRG